MLRTAMCSAQANRYYGPPDGSQPEFDLLAFAISLENDDALFYRPPAPAAAVELTRLQLPGEQSETIHHNCSSWKAQVTRIPVTLAKKPGQQSSCRK